MTARISRRITLGWVAAVSASVSTMAGGEWALGASDGYGSPENFWSDSELPPIRAAGYGQDPNLANPIIPWPLTLGESQRAVLRIAADLLLPSDARSPSAGTLHIDGFVDEWISAPYPQQQQDRVLILRGLRWLDAEAIHQFGANFQRASDAQRRSLFDRIAFRKAVKVGYEKPAQFFARLRGLMLAAFYSLPPGIADIGYLGNVPHLGDYVGPTAEAMEHLNANLTKLGLKPFDPD